MNTKKLKSLNHIFSRFYSTRNEPLFIIISLLITLIFCSCTQLFQQKINNSQKSLVHIKVTMPSNSVSAIQSRSAVPSLPDISSVAFKITAVSSSIPVQKIVETIPVSDTEASFMLEIGEDTWSIIAEGFIIPSDNQNHEDIFKEENKIFYGEEKLTINGKGKFDCFVPVYFISEDSGSLNLEINVADSEIDYVMIGGTNNQFDGKYIKNHNNIIKIEKTNVKAGSYDCFLTFYQNQVNLESEQEQNAQVISFVEKINVRKNTETDTWIKSGNAIYFTSDADSQKTVFYLSKEIITKLVNNSIYISCKNEDSLLPNIQVSIENTKNGTWANPFDSLQDAFNKIIALNNNHQRKNNESETYYLYIDGMVPVNNAIFQSDIPVSIVMQSYAGQSDNTNAYLKYEETQNQNNQKQNNKSIDEKNLFQVKENVTLQIKNLAMKQGNIRISKEAHLVLNSASYLENGSYILNSGACLFLDSYSPINNITQNIFCNSPQKDDIIIKENDNSKLTEETIGNFQLTNNGYYLDYDSKQNAGVVKYSTIGIKLPHITSLDVNISVRNSEKEIGTLSSEQPYFILDKESVAKGEIFFEISVDLPDSEGETSKKLEAENISAQLFQDSTKLSCQEQKKSDFVKTVILPKNQLLPGNYLLNIHYIYDGLLYDEKIILKIN